MPIELLVIDPQVDFCDPERGALYVGGAERDVERIAALVESASGALFDRIHVTLDSHNTVHIAHPVYWENAAGEHPAPFTIISAGEIARGQWRATDPVQRAHGLAYAQALERGGRYQLCIWPYHCLIGTPGHCVMPRLAHALAEVERATLRAVNYIIKGSNPHTEHYSAVRAEVAIPGDPNTETNQALVAMARRADQLVVAGEAGSHCVANTVRDLVDAAGADAAGKITLLSDAVSPVRGFEGLQEEFVATMRARGMRTKTTEEFCGG